VVLLLQCPVWCWFFNQHVASRDWIWRQLCLRLQLTCHLLSAGCCCRLYLLQLAGFELSHSPNPAGFIYLVFSWMPIPSLFSSVKSCQPIYNCRLVYLQFVSHCCNLFPLQALWLGPLNPPSQAGSFIYSSCGELPILHSPAEPAALQALLQVFSTLSLLG
jgi:hypothetical protein